VRRVAEQPGDDESRSRGLKAWCLTTCSAGACKAPRGQATCRHDLANVFSVKGVLQPSSQKTWSLVACQLELGRFCAAAVLPTVMSTGHVCHRSLQDVTLPSILPTLTSSNVSCCTATRGPGRLLYVPTEPGGCRAATDEPAVLTFGKKFNQSCRVSRCRAVCRH
jgi:hypothetical protein